MSKRATEHFVGAEPTWYKDAIIYEVHVRAFHDSNGDGIGDFPGLTAKLDYLQDLGVTAIWLLPFYPSPLRDDGYDIADYTGVHPSYGTLRDFKVFLAQAHLRGIRVITELVLNHTSDQHPWFQRARTAPAGSVHRDFYVWSDDPQRYGEARVIFKDFEVSNWAWDHAAQAYYWHRFYAHQPDLNFDSAHVRKALFKVVDFWLGLGVDGLRLDAVPYLFEREGTAGENLPSTHAFLKEMRRHIDERFADRMVLAEANQWPEDAADYFGDGDECNMAFHFPLMPRLFMSVRQEDRFPIVDIMSQTPPLPDSAQWALFLRNHDELTLEMVTDEEREYMYRVYAEHPEAQINLGIRRRLTPLLGNNRRRIELMNGLLFSMPGTPVLYYGDEIGMGDNIFLGDRNGVRTPMQWSADRNAGFSMANPQQLYAPLIVDPEYHHATVNVEAQQQNGSSLLNWMKRLIALRKHYTTFGRGDLSFLQPSNRRVLAFLRTFGDEKLLVVANLSRFTQVAELDLAAFEGCVPVELFGRTPFPKVGALPYMLTLAPHTFHWFSLEAPPAAAEQAPLPRLEVAGAWQAVLSGAARSLLEQAMPRFLEGQRWFAGKARTLLDTRIGEVLEVPDARNGVLALVKVVYSDGDPETYLVPLGYASGSRAETLRAEHPDAIVAELTVDGRAPGVLYDALLDMRFVEQLFAAVAHGRRLPGESGSALGTPTSALRRLRSAVPKPEAIESEQSNTSLRFGDRWVLKLFRRLEPGVNPEREIGQFLTEREFGISPAVDGTLVYSSDRLRAIDLGILHQYVANQGSAWEHTLAELERFWKRVAGIAPPTAVPATRTAALLELAEAGLPDDACALLGPYVETARQLGRDTARLHCTLSEAADAPLFAPEEFTQFYQRSLYQSMHGLFGRVLYALREAQPEVDAAVRPDVDWLLDQQRELTKRLEVLRKRPLSGVRMRIHGNYHLGQLLATGDEWCIIDFEGEPNRPLYERELKRSPLLDIATLLQSWHAALVTATQRRGGNGAREHAVAWGRQWFAWVCSAFLQEYLAVARRDGTCLPHTRAEIAALLDVFRIERTIYELGYELDTRPDTLHVPLTTVRQALEWL